MSLSDRMKPAVRKRSLLLLAGLVWTTAGLILLWRGISYLHPLGKPLALPLLLAIGAGILLYLILFMRISRRHIVRILGLDIPYPCAFSFFSMRSYMLMGLMIAAGITLRKCNLVRPDLIYPFYITMSVPLLISSARFFLAWGANSGLP